MTHDRLISRILLATDGSDLSLRAARYVQEIAECTGAEVTILNVAEVSGLTQFVAHAMESRRVPTSDPRETGEVITARTKEVFPEGRIPVHTKIIEGSAPEIILREARDGGYGLIVMGSRGAGMGFVDRVVFGLGSVAQRVVGNSPCPVLIVRE